MNRTAQWPRPWQPAGRRVARRTVVALLLGVLLTFNGCKNEPTPIEPGTTPAANANGPAGPAASEEAPALPPGHPPIPGMTAPESPALPPGHPPIAPPASESPATTRPAERRPVPPAVLGTKQTKLEGILLTVPEGWAAEPVSATPGMPAALAPKAVYRLATGPADPDAVNVRVSHFPDMRAMDNLVQDNLDRWYAMLQQPDGRATSEVARTQTFEAGPCRVTVTHFTGNHRNLPNQGMIGAIIEHPKGPYFVKANGSAAGVEAWKPHIDLYLKSIRASE